MLPSFSELMKSVSGILLNLEDSEMYLAHIHPAKKAELLSEHVILVNNYAEKLVKVHGLNDTIDSLIKDAVSGWDDTEKCAVVLKKCFAGVVMFHDFGKINENFQALRMNNVGSFSVNKKTVLSPIYGHSKLGSFLYLNFFIDSIYKSDVSGSSKILLVAYCYILSYSITQHHSPALFSVTGNEEYLIAFKELFSGLKKYLESYKWLVDENKLITVFDKLEQVWISSIKEKRVYKPFSFFTLVKLNFSVLTAADYLATHHYSSSSENGNEGETSDFGVFLDRNRIKEIASHLQSIEHNAAAFEKGANYKFEHPVQKSNKNLNKLREEMAVAVIQTVRKHTDKHLFYLEAPTGGGKTNLSAIIATELLLANPELNKIYYVFPFTTLITQTFASLQTSMGLQNNEIAELHSKAGFLSKSNNRTPEELKDGLYFGEEKDSKKDYIDNLFALFPITLLSHVKFFDILKTNGKEVNYLLHRLANSVVIIDELQTYNPKQWDKMLFFIINYAKHFNIRFVLMSATLPKISGLKTGIGDVPEFVDLLPNAKSYITNPNFSERVSFNFELFSKGEITIEELADVVLLKSTDYVKAYGSVKTIIEFIYKKSAAAFLKQVKESKLFRKIFLLSGTILESRRKEIINYIKQNTDENILLITTQVVEAGVDIDMDLGFKNVSLIDSDEQLAGRVNRNASKSTCEVYLFKMDDASILYGADYRYKKTREEIPPVEYQNILKTKNFSLLYDKVLGYIDKINKPNPKDSIQGYSDYLFNLDYPNVDRNFKIIEQDSASIFVPLSVPLQIDGVKKNETENVFTPDELRFLSTAGICPVENEISGEDVWSFYESLIGQKIQSKKAKKGFDLQNEIDFKQLQSIMSKFTFSLMQFGKDYVSLLRFGEEKYGYLYLNNWEEQVFDQKPYSYKDGLNNAVFKEANFL